VRSLRRCATQRPIAKLRLLLRLTLSVGPILCSRTVCLSNKGLDLPCKRMKVRIEIVCNHDCYDKKWAAVVDQNIRNFAKNFGSPSLVSELGVSRTTECLRYSQPLNLIHLALLTNPSSGIGELPLQSFTKLFKVPNLAGPTLNCRFQNNPDLQIRSKYTLDMKSCRFCKVNETTIRHG
jgi:hypothetical protein